jgi:adenylyltransferase/sulfurtransferase
LRHVTRFAPEAFRLERADVKFTREALKRYSRQILLPEIGLEGQTKLSNSSALVIGAGGLGAPVLTYLVSSGVRRVIVAEHDTVDFSNLQRQFLYSTADVGRPKLEVALERLSALNLLVKLEGAEKFGAENAATLVSSVDVVVDASDNAATRYLVSDTCVTLERTWVWGAAEGFTGMTCVFDHRLSLRDAFSEGGSDDNCDTIGVFAPLLGTVGSHMAGAALRLLLGLEVRRGELTLWDALEGSSRTVKLRGAEG